MKFSLKDLFYSVTLASCGMAIIPFVVIFGKEPSAGLPNGTYILLMLSFLFILFLPGALLGAAVGNLFHQLKKGVQLGLLSELNLLIVGGLWYAFFVQMW